MPRRRRKTRPDRSKKAALKIHAGRRAAERYGLESWPRRRTIDAIRSGDTRQARFLKRQSRTVSIWAVKIEGRIVPVVYNRRIGDIATVLPESWFARNGFRVIDDPDDTPPGNPAPET